MFAYLKNAGEEDRKRIHQLVLFPQVTFDTLNAEIIFGGKYRDVSVLISDKPETVYVHEDVLMKLEELGLLILKEMGIVYIMGSTSLVRYPKDAHILWKYAAERMFQTVVTDVAEALPLEMLEKNFFRHFGAIAKKGKIDAHIAFLMKAVVKAGIFCER